MKLRVGVLCCSLCDFRFLCLFSFVVVVGLILSALWAGMASPEGQRPPFVVVSEGLNCGIGCEFCLQTLLLWKSVF